MFDYHGREFTGTDAYCLICIVKRYLRDTFYHFKTKVKF